MSCNIWVTATSANGNVTIRHRANFRLPKRDIRLLPIPRGLIVDRETANLAAARWLREVANARIHGTTGAIPAERLVSERMRLQQVPTPYGGRTVRALQAKPEPVPIIGMQHPLSLYDAFAAGVR
jgi:hypothetical protein